MKETTTMLQSMIRLTLLLVLSATATAQIETVTYLHTDHLGSPVVARDALGNTVWEEAYDPWGVRIAAPAGNDADVGFTGHYEETAVGLTYAQARWYDAEVGRFLSVDPVGYQAGGSQHFERYSYSINNPVRYLDPNGQDSISMNVQFNAPGIFGTGVMLTNLLLGTDLISPDGLEFGITGSFDGFTPAEKQVAAGVGGIFGVEAGYDGFVDRGVGRQLWNMLRGGVVVELEYDARNEDAISVQNGPGKTEVGGHFLTLGGAMIYGNETRNLEGVSLTVGPGLNAGATFTEKRGVILYGGE